MSNIIKRKALTIEDLVKFCRENKIYAFNAQEQGFRLSVQVPTTFEIDNDVDDAHRGMLKLKFRIFHLGKNRNGSYVSESSAKDAMPTIKNRPVLAAIHQLDNGEWDFESHNVEIITNDDGTQETNYIEKQVGSFDESDPFFEYDEQLDKTYVCSYAYIPEEYTKAADIIKAKKGTKNSCELSIDILSYNAQEDCLSLDKFYVSASTLLGRTSEGKEIGEGMLGSRADIADFSLEKNSISHSSSAEINNKLIKTPEKLDNDFSSFDNMQELHENDEDHTVSIVAQPVQRSENESIIEPEEVGNVPTKPMVAEPQNEEVVTKPNNEKLKPEKFSIVMSDGSERTFQLSLSDIQYALSALVNDTYSEADNCWYAVTVFEDQTVVMQDYWTGKAYRQSYTRDENNFALSGERVEVFANWLTEQEESALAELRSNFESVSTKLDQYVQAENAQRKEDILNSEDYAVIRDSEEFEQIIANVDSYDVSEVQAKCDALLLSYAKQNFAVKGEPQRGIKIKTGIREPEYKPYGSLFN